MSRAPQRLVPQRPFPPYTYVPGGEWPHPLSDPRGHSFGKQRKPGEPLTAQNWPASEDYLFGIDLFNAGFFWEAHEVWEGLWQAAGRTGLMADFLKGLIKLAAAGVKRRQGVTPGVEGHARRAAEVFERPAQRQQSHCLGLDVDWLSRTARAWSLAPTQAPPMLRLSHTQELDSSALRAWEGPA